MSFHTRKNIRLSGYDYRNAGAYFITICSRERQPYFGHIIDGKMILNNLGLYTTEHRNHISDHYPFVVPDIFVCMPDHVHGILMIGEHDITRTDKNPSLHGTDKNPSLHGTDKNSSLYGTDKNPSLQATCLSGSLGSIIRGFKIGITKYAQQHDISFAWQSRYYDHIIRNEGSYTKIQHYIQMNPENREKDGIYEREW